MSSDRIAILHRLRPDTAEIDVEVARNPHEIARVDFSGSPASQSRIVARIRAHWPAVRIVLRADSGFAREALMNWYEANGWIFCSAWPARPGIWRSVG